MLNKFLSTEGGRFDVFPEQATAAGDDRLLLEDSRNSYEKKHIKIDNVCIRLHLKFDAGSATFPASNPAATSSRNDHQILAFDAAVAESVLFNSVMTRGYPGENIDVKIFWVAATAAANDVKWGVEWERMNVGVLDVDNDSFAAQRTQVDTAPGTCGQIKVTTIGFTQAQADGVAAGEVFRIRLQRLAADAADTMAGDAQVLCVAIEGQ